MDKLPLQEDTIYLRIVDFSLSLKYVKYWQVHWLCRTVDIWILIIKSSQGYKSSNKMNQLATEICLLWLATE